VKESLYNVWVERWNAWYVFNGVSGALLRVSGDNYRALRRFLSREDEAACPPSLLANLALGRMLVPDGLDERTLLAGRYEASRHDNSHFALTIVTSLGCNFDCPYCFEDKQPSIMAADVEHALLSVLDDQLPRIHTFDVTWYGGEPLVGKASLLRLSDGFIDSCERADVAFTANIITNGYLLDPETCTQLADRRVTSAQVTLDGPPEIHDRMRPQAGGRGSFWGIIRNLHHAVNHLQITIRVNLDADNIDHAEALLLLLRDEGFAGKASVYPAHINATNDGVPAPSARYQGCCLSKAQFARAELRFGELARSYGFSRADLPMPVGAPCTAVRANELVVGSEGELYKCWASPGNPGEVIGNIRDYRQPNGRLQKWLKYDPFVDAECRSCIALPVCMGGCAHHAMDPLQYENRCGTFRHTYREQVLAFVEQCEREGREGVVPSVQIARRMETR
jgi:uncharacterized protein